MLGVSWQDIKNALEKFKGVKRRMESLGDWQGIKFIADYAHHPKEISATIKTLEESGKDFAIIFQPHTYSRTKILMKDFVEILSKVERLIIYKTYPAREIEDESANAKALYEKVKKESINQVEYADNELALKRVLKKHVNSVTRAIFVGAGDIYEIAKKIIKN
jgi:UDP-N-acetylmuramate--alanine ligase